MPCVFVAKSKALCEWGGDVGLSSHLYKLGVFDGDGKQAVLALNEAKFAGRTDWTLAKAESFDEVPDEAQLYERLGRKEKMVETRLYPGLKGGEGVFKVKITNVESSILVKAALEGIHAEIKKPKASEIGAYLIANAMK
jgi:hypothetical protein